MDTPRKPPVKAESRDERVTIRLTSSELVHFRGRAQDRGEELSRYIRRCAVIGDRVIEQVA
jgi:predicted DNA binding CopG/RHH family protein